MQSTQSVNVRRCYSVGIVGHGFVGHAIGVNACIAKPFPPSGRTLTAVIEETLNKHRGKKKSGSSPSRQAASEGNSASDWLTVTKAAGLLQRDLPALDLDKARARVSGAANRGEFKSAGSRRGRRIDPDSFAAWRLKQRDRDLDAEDAAEES